MERYDLKKFKAWSHSWIRMTGYPYQLFDSKHFSVAYSQRAVKNKNIPSMTQFSIVHTTGWNLRKWFLLTSILSLKMKVLAFFTLWEKNDFSGLNQKTWKYTSVPYWVVMNVILNLQSKSTQILYQGLSHCFCQNGMLPTVFCQHQMVMLMITWE